MTSGTNRFRRIFLRHRSAALAAGVLFVMVLVVLLAPLIANDKPLLLKLNGEYFFPAVVDYVPADLGLKGYSIDYLRLERELPAGSFALFPPIKQRVNEPNLNFDDLPAPPGSRSMIGADEGFIGVGTYHIIGTDTAGRDLLTRLIYALRVSLFCAIAMALLSLLVGTLLGALMGYIGGKFDLFMGRLLEAIGHFPAIFLIIVLVAFIKDPGLSSIIFIFGFLGMARYAFYMRGQVLAVKNQAYVEAARGMGLSDRRIIFRHILPNALGPTLVLIPFDITANITSLSIIDFLGFGVQPPTASLGAIIRSGYESVDERWWLVLYASLSLIFILVIVNLIGEGIRDALDPHTSLSSSVRTSPSKTSGPAG